MCRFIAYTGKPITVDELIVKPENSLINQSYDAKEMSQPLNGDGFGIGWYMKHLRVEPALLRSVTPAWSNQNLIYNASAIQSDCMFAHVRAASEGGISEANCHPFNYKQYLMMHNGSICHFKKIKRRLQQCLSDDLFLWIRGQTDSEHLFALLIQNLSELPRAAGEDFGTGDLVEAFKRTFAMIEEMKVEADIAHRASTFNVMVTDGTRIFGTRYSSDTSKSTRSLYYSRGAQLGCVDGEYKIRDVDDPDEKAVLIASEKLTNRAADWNAVPDNHFIAVDSDLNVELGPLD